MPPRVKSVATQPCEILRFFKNYIDRKRNNGRPDVRMYWRECDRSMRAGTKPIRPATNSSFNTLKLQTKITMKKWSVWHQTVQFKETPAGERIEANYHVRFSCSKQLPSDVIFIRFIDGKSYSH